MLTIVIPARNEEAVILKTLEKIKSTVKIPHKIIVINDFSNDRTEEVVKRYQKKQKKITIIRTNNKMRGFSGALKHGFDEAKSGFVVPVMADLCDDPATINKMYSKIQGGWDIVCGSRYIKGGGKEGGPGLQGFLSQIVCKSLHCLTGISTEDVSNAFKMYRKEVLRNITISSGGGVEASMEITLQAYFQGAKIVDVPTRWVGRRIGKSKFKLLQRAPKYLKIYLWALEHSIRKRLGRPKDFYL